jgi:hypothetical protein
MPEYGQAEYFLPPQRVSIIAEKSHTMSAGFRGTAAAVSADLMLLLEVVIGIGWWLGSVLARKKRYRARLVSVPGRSP